MGATYTRCSRSSTPLHGVCFSVALVAFSTAHPRSPALFLDHYRFEPDLLRLLLSLSCPANPSSSRQLPPSMSRPYSLLVHVPHDYPLHMLDPPLVSALCAPPSPPARALLLLHARRPSLGPP
ncbi:hypothetical protein B0H13DRAFT_2367123 [Mycena leptocephala]|nr:hypothetical protein B0H13DRAFT_2367123 [Mycena leptocephala]